MTDCDLRDAGRLRLVELPPPSHGPAVEARIDAAWRDAIRGNPHLFDGPVAACVRVGEDDEGFVLGWARTTYRQYTGRIDPSLPLVPCLFVVVALFDVHGRVLVGRATRQTATPGQWQLPGGNVEPPDPDLPLTTGALRAHASVELAEETGMVVPAERLRPWLVVRRRNGDVGVVFRSGPHEAAEVEERHARLVAAERDAGRHPELDRLAWVWSPDDAALCDGEPVDYLDQLLDIVRPGRRSSRWRTA